MDLSIAQLSDELAAYRAEIKRIRAAAQRVLDASNFDSTEDLMNFDRELRSLQRELDRISPSGLLSPAKKFGRRH